MGYLKDGKNTGSGVLTFESAEATENAIFELSGSMLNSVSITVDAWAEKTPDEEKKPRLIKATKGKTAGKGDEPLLIAKPKVAPKAGKAGGVRKPIGSKA